MTEKSWRALHQLHPTFITLPQLSLACKGYFVIPAKAGIQYQYKKALEFSTNKNMNPGYVYILASQKNGTLYIGVTSDLVARVYEHKEGLAEGFTKKHGVKTLVYFEAHDSIEDAIHRETQLKKWNRLWKLRLIEEQNPGWRDLYNDII